MNGRAWTAKEDAALRQMRQDGRSYLDISRHLRRPFEGVKARAKILKVWGVVVEDDDMTIPACSERFVADGLRIYAAVRA